MRYSVKGIDGCTSSFEYNRKELCINPYHYKKAIEIAPAMAPAMAPATAMAPAMAPDEIPPDLIDIDLSPWVLEH